MYPLLEELLYCLDSGFPAEVTTALLTLADCASDANLKVLVAVWGRFWDGTSGDLVDAITEVCESQEAYACDCGRIVWMDDTTEVASGNTVCDVHCIPANYTQCYRCGEWHGDDDVTRVEGDSYCEGCCDSCATWCHDCDEWYLDVHEDQHTHDEDDEDDDDDESGSCCSAPHFYFSFPANGAGTVANDERLVVELPAGMIDNEGMESIVQLVILHIDEKWMVREVVHEVGPIWQAKRGNFTRRLSSAFHKRGVKLPPLVISEVGNLARAHSSGEATWHIEVTRDLNLPASAFYHDDSCWWGGYSKSRCCLKNWGGIGLRTFQGTNSYPTGRAWIQPLNADLQPTHDALGAKAYVVYNGYGDLEGYVGARIVAHLTGRTYRKIDFDADGIYVNNTTGYLVADDTTCEDTSRLYFQYDPHNTHDAHDYLDRVEMPA